MDQIRLPFVVGDAPLWHVFDRMAEAGVHAAIVVPPGRDPMLVTNHDVDEALENGFSSVSQVTGPPLHVDRSDLDWERALDAMGLQFGMIREEPFWGGGFADRGAQSGTSMDRGTRARHADTGPGESTAILVTRHEGLGAAIRGRARVCRCMNNHRAPGGGRCPYCNSAVRCA